MNSTEKQYNCETLSRIEHVVKQIDNRSGEDSGLRLAFGLMFHTAAGADGIQRVRMTDISKRMHISKSAATYIVKNLVNQNLVRRIEDEKDHRIIYIEPTEEGREIFDQSVKSRLDLLTRAFKRLGPDNEHIFIDLFNQFLEALLLEMGGT